MTPAFASFSMVARGQRPEPRQLIPKALTVEGIKLIPERRREVRPAPIVLVNSILK